MATNNNLNWKPNPYSVLVGNSNGSVSNISTGLNGQVLISNGLLSAPSFSYMPITLSGTNATSFTQTNGIVTYNGTSLVNYAGPQINSSGVQTNTSQIAFNSYVSSNVSSVTGDGTLVTVQFNSTNLNNQSCFNSSTYTFTAPVAGIYFFSINFAARQLGGSLYQNLFLITTSNTYNFIIGNLANSNNDQVFGIYVCSKMSLNETAYVQYQASGGAKTAGYYQNSLFSGFLIC